MKCPKCGFNSFDYLNSCKKCGSDVREFKARFNLRSLLFPGRDKVAEAAFADLKSADVTLPPGGDETDFDAGLMDEADELAGEVSDDAGFSLDDDLGDAFEDTPDVASIRAQDETTSGFEEADFLTESVWEEEPLPELSLGEEDLAVSEGEAAELGGFAFNESQEDEPQLPPLEDLDFEELGDAPESKIEIAEDFWEDEAAKAPGKAAIARAADGKEGSAGPFDGPESAAAVQTSVNDATTGSNQEQKTAQMALFLESDSAQAVLPGPTLLLPALPARLGAFWLDVFLVVGGFLLFLIIGTRLLAPVGSATLLPSLHELIRLSQPYYLVLFLVCFSYFTAFHFFIGQTPGKMLFGLRLEGKEGHDLLFSEAFLHSVGGLLSLLSLGIGFVFALSHPEGRGWNDRIAGTRLVALPAEE